MQLLRGIRCLHSIQETAQVNATHFGGLCITLGTWFPCDGIGYFACGPTGPGLNPARDLGPRILHKSCLSLFLEN